MDCNIIFYTNYLHGLRSPFHSKYRILSETEFRSKEWLTNKDERYELSDHLIDSKILIGKTKTDVKKLLGDEGNKDEQSEWYYEIGIRQDLEISTQIA